MTYSHSLALKFFVFPATLLTVWLIGNKNVKRLGVEANGLLFANKLVRQFATEVNWQSRFTASLRPAIGFHSEHCLLNIDFLTLVQSLNGAFTFLSSY